jgi:large subunit ribosomal protein L22
MEAIAKTKYLKGSPRKARLVIDLIRGVNVSRALSILRFTDKRAAQPIAQCLNSAIANATYKAEQENIAIDPDDLWVKSCFVDMGPTKGRKRMRPAPQGRAYREQRHYCHITIQLTSEEKPKTEKELKAEAAKARRAAEGGTDKPKRGTKSAKAEQAKSAPAPAEEVLDTPAADTVGTEDSVETPVVETARPESHAESTAETALDDTAAAEAGAEEPLADEQVEAAPAVEETPQAAAAKIMAEGDAEVADAKNVETQTTAALNETKPADEAQLNINEELERQ